LASNLIFWEEVGERGKIFFDNRSTMYDSGGADNADGDLFAV